MLATHEDAAAAAVHAAAQLASVRRALPYVAPLLARVAGAHRARNPKLDPLCDAGLALVDAIEAHLDEPGPGARLPAEAPAHGEPRRRPAACGHPAEIARLLARVRALADGYAAPDWASRAYRTLMEELEALEAGLAEGLGVRPLAPAAPALAA